nr:DUF1120 domain-containing protein [Pseudomonas tolaasii]
MNTLIATLILASTGHAFAASSTDLTVRGLITPSACTPSLGNGGVHDLGKIASKDLNAETYTRLEKHTMQFEVTCEAPTLLALENKDNRAGSEFDEGGGFGLGMINGNEKLGVLAATLASSMADGVTVRTINAWMDGAWEAGNFVLPGYLISVANNTTLAPIPVQHWTADLILAPIIAATNTLTLDNEAIIDGSVTLTVRYL